MASDHVVECESFQLWFANYKRTCSIRNASLQKLGSSSVPNTNKPNDQQTVILNPAVVTPTKIVFLNLGEDGY
jgi:hypothetical protein